ncbi:Acetyltransferase (GNAT) domain-containing protein [Pseudobutyrivibrio sp. 49]|uniref:GNAT family N-acetyltransferase n=1 Tax=Pseudobutyrivibrio sp. 49 TaxID=1855344 RepID=UPI0008918E06|nr:GNAT family N-acetyltransferase [Pseudobutyrivibrio sp. 49]SDI84878.1 Acetyltransferase (GNAT) domain-containing protein [Pseudobutyrivibrio sp. 49]
MDIEYFNEIPDYESYVNLRLSVGWKIFCKEQMEKAISRSCYSIIAKIDDEIVGMARAVGDSMYYTIVDVIVNPKYQGQHIGSNIIQRLIHEIELNIPKGGRVLISLIAASGKEDFYVKQGFSIIPDEESGPGLRKIIYGE